MNDLISIIVPIYKVEQYLKKCIDSVINQTYSNLEIILVDDGSPDDCGDICDEYAKRDNRIIVVHKENGGLSSARNTGINIAKGKYICFLDSDDYVSTDYVEVLYKNLIDKNCDIVACDFRYVYENGVEKFSGLLNDDVSLVNNEILNYLFHGKANLLLIISNSKIYKKELFNEIRYTEGIIHEDEDIAHKLLLLSKRVCILNTPMYYYLQRESSITGDLNIEKKMIILEILKNRYLYLKQNSLEKSIVDYSAYSYLVTHLIYADMCYKKGNKEKYKELLNISKKIKKEVYKGFALKLKIKFLIKNVMCKMHILWIVS